MKKAELGITLYSNLSSVVHLVLSCCLVYQCAWACQWLGLEGCWCLHKVFTIAYIGEQSRTTRSKNVTIVTGHGARYEDVAGTQVTRNGRREAWSSALARARKVFHADYRRGLTAFSRSANMGPGEKSCFSSDGNQSEKCFLVIFSRGIKL